MLVDTIVSIYAPYSCLTCQKQGRVVCEQCLPGLASPKKSSCFLCNKLTPGWRVCKSCQSKTSLRGVYVGSHYEARVKTLVRMLKYERAQGVSPTLAKVIAPVVKDAPEFDFVTAIPATSSRFRQRGYNQAKLIGKALACELKLPFHEVLGRFGNTRQVGTNRQNRIKQAEQTMYCTKTDRVYGKRILVVDDVVTTGATMKEAARVLKLAGVKYAWGGACAKH